MLIFDTMHLFLNAKERKKYFTRCIIVLRWVEEKLSFAKAVAFAFCAAKLECGVDSIWHQVELPVNLLKFAVPTHNCE